MTDASGLVPVITTVSPSFRASGSIPPIVNARAHLWHAWRSSKGCTRSLVQTGHETHAASGMSASDRSRSTATCVGRISSSTPPPVPRSLGTTSPGCGWNVIGSRPCRAAHSPGVVLPLTISRAIWSAGMPVARDKVAACRFAMERARRFVNTRITTTTCFQRQLCQMCATQAIKESSNSPGDHRKPLQPQGFLVVGVTGLEPVTPAL
jgi:hypothetical protein